MGSPSVGVVSKTRIEASPQEGEVITAANGDAFLHMGGVPILWKPLGCAAWCRWTNNKPLHRDKTVALIMWRSGR